MSSFGHYGDGGGGRPLDPWEKPGWKGEKRSDEERDEYRLVTIQEAIDPYGEANWAWLVRQPTDDLSATHVLMTLGGYERSQNEILRLRTRYEPDGSEGCVLERLADEIDRLRAELDEACKIADRWIEKSIEKDKRIAELERQVVLSGWNDFEGDITGLNIITDDQINDAWEFSEECYARGEENARFALGELGIFACLGCGGSGVQNDVYDLGKVIHEQSCAVCGGHGWVAGGDDD